MKDQYYSEIIAESPKTFENDNTCGICIEEFGGKNEDEKEFPIVKMPQCPHYFHKHCIIEWIDTQINKLERPNCPSCREPFVRQPTER